MKKVLLQELFFYELQNDMPKYYQRTVLDDETIIWEHKTQYGTFSIITDKRQLELETAYDQITI